MLRSIGLKVALAFLVMALAWPGSVAGASVAASSYYVDCSAASGGNGSQTSPWNSLATVNAHGFAAGDRLLFARGVTCAGQLKPSGSGTAAAPITIDAYGTGTARPVIAGGGAVYAAIHLYNVQYWEVRGLEVTNLGASAAERNGILVELADFGTGSHYVIGNVYVHDVNGGDTKNSNGIQFRVSGTTTPTHFNGVTVENSEIYRVDREGLTTASSWGCRAIYACTSGPAWTANTNIVFRNNRIHDIGGDGIVLRIGADAVVERNTAYDIWMRSAGNNAGIWTINSDRTVVQYNEVYRVRRPCCNDGMAFDSDGGNRGVVFQYNYSHDNEGGFVLFCGCSSGWSTSGTTVRYNLSVNDKSRILYAAGESAAQIYGNTIYLPAGSTTKIIEDNGSASTKATWTNNLIYNLGSGGYDQVGNYVFRGNLYYGNHPASEPSDPYKSTANPLLAAPGSSAPDGYQLGSGSPALRSGLNLVGSSPTDYFGNPVPGSCRPDIGFHQRSAFDDAACVGSNLVQNGGFESGTTASWSVTAGRASVVTDTAHGGAKSLKLGPSQASAEQVVAVQPGTTYVLSGWGRVSAYDTEIVIGAKAFGGPSEIRAPAFVNTTWRGGSVTFTTGPSSTTATVYCFTRAGAGSGYCDDLTLTRQSS
ncbi:carbohydrate binding domain-containing protein [Kribbella sp. NPDC003557]|uniref:carbohydrate binding domain-containing protein n=1 Tax=Kribbella sp. NPDC003557 TaxID=3154449 RepID=UPI0033B005EC